jgi:phenylacetyl-CoA:acceptor oxidoreductase subunit 2
MLQAAKGIPAWRAPQTVPLIVLTGLTEGGGWLLFLSTTTSVAPHPLLLVAMGALLLARAWVWRAHRQGVARQAAPRALTALDEAGRWILWAGTAAPLVALALAVLGGGWPLLGLAGLLAAGSGAWLKYVLITRAGFNQGFALQHLPVRGAVR